MNVQSLCDEPTAHALGFSWLVDAVRPASASGERAFATLRPYRSGQEAQALVRASEIAALAEAAGASRLDDAHALCRRVPDVAGILARAAMGDVLGDADFLELLRFGDAIERLDALLMHCAGYVPIANASLVRLRDALEPGRAGAFGFYLADAFAPGLAGARAEFQQRQAAFESARGRALQAIAQSLHRDDLAGDEFVVLRADLDGPLPQGVRVLREGPGYLLCVPELAPQALDDLARRDAAASAVATAEEGVRAALSALAGEMSDRLQACDLALGQCDVRVAAARFCARWMGTVADIVPTATLAFSGARFVPLEAQLALEGRTFAPLDIVLDGVAVLTGPNMGGKSVCLRTCGFVALCAAFGLPVPARSARSALFDAIAWLGIGGDAEPLGGLLSSFAKEVVRVRDVLALPARQVLVLIDEFARTTTPHEGGALLIALLDRLRARGACGLAATHLSGIARAAGLRHFAVRGLRGTAIPPPAGDPEAALERLAAAMDYSVEEVLGDGDAGADALALAALLGLDAELVADAYRQLRSRSES